MSLFPEAFHEFALIPHFSHHISTDSALNGRVSRLHLQQRLGIERDHEARIFGQGLKFFHLENWYSVHRLIRATLWVCGMHGRGKRNARDIQVRHNDIYLPDLPAAFNGFTILHLSDLHLDGPPDINQALVERVRTVDYDIGVVTGDFRQRTYGAHEPAIDAMEYLRPHLKNSVYGVLGNHDTIQMVPPLETLGIRMLMNEAVGLERDGEAIYLAGIDDPHYFQADNLEKACESIPPQAISILLSHSPEIYRHAAHVGFNVMLCGHTHGGQICLPGGMPILSNARCPRKYCAGAWQYHQLLGYTSVGAGSSVVDIRLNCRPEITLHHLWVA